MSSDLILASILSADLTHLGQEVDLVLEAGADFIHFDVMDNHYVPNLTFGPALCEALIKKNPKRRVDVHLMASPVESLIRQFAKAGAQRISIHPEACLHLDRDLQLIQEQGCLAGLALNPASSIDCLRWSAKRLDFVLVMTVNPGFAGQTLIPFVLEKIREIKQNYPHLNICVDGGVKLENIADLKKAGANQFIAGSAIFESPCYRETLKAMREALSSLEFL